VTLSTARRPHAHPGCRAAAPWAPAGLAVALLVAAVSAEAAVAGIPGAECLAIPGESERLACFDRAVGDAARAAHGAAAPVESDAAPGATVAAAAAPVPDSAEAAPAMPQAAPPSLIDAAWGFLPGSRKAYVRLYQPNYILLARYTSDVNREPYEPLFEAFAEDYDFEDVEAKFQLSFKGRLATTEDRRWGLWFAYTQQSQWQVYNDDISSPFRETNYMPELFGSFRPGVEIGGLNFNLLNFGFNHQSNGRADPISRSWDRLFIEGGLDRGNFALLVRAWTRVKPGDYEDDNPDIMDYMGHGQVTALYRWQGNTFTLMGRGNLSTGKGAAQFDWTSRPVLGPLRVYFQLFSGYGESLIDYDWNQTTVGLGVALNDLL
jgi:phospholipase A1